jgi:periplasmic copper chaperone A
MRSFSALLLAASFAMFPAAAAAHVSVTSGPAFADSTQEVVFGVGHGCEGHDTRSVRIELPAEVVSVRALTSDLGTAQVELDDAELVRAVTWEKPAESVLDADTNYYKLALRIRVPNQPFTTLYFPTYQVCLASDGTEIQVDWVSMVQNETEGGPEPAPALHVLPKRFAGWNQFVVPDAVENLSIFFADALIVWKDDAAYSANPATAELIASTPGVTELTALAASDEIWVKY